MKNLIYFVFIGVLGLTACQDPMSAKARALQQVIDARVSQDMAALATFESTYNLVFKSAKPSWIWDSFYVREEIARVPYGYQLSDIAVRVQEENGKTLLRVSLPTKPTRMPIDRRMVEKPITNNENYVVKDSEGNIIDVDTELNKNMQRVLNKYESLVFEEGRNLTRQYFANLAKGFGLELNIEFKDK